MPLFMFISGYVSFYSKGKPLLSLQKKAISLLIPFFSWGIVSFVNMILFKNAHWNEFGNFIIHIILHPDDNGLWFLWVLFSINIVVFSCKMLKINLELGIAIFWILLNFLFLKWPNLNYFGLSLLKYHLFYFLLGLFFCRTKSRYYFIYKYLLYACCFCFPFLVFFWYRLSPPSFIENLNLSTISTKLLWLSYQYVCAIVGIGIAMKLIEFSSSLKFTLLAYLKKTGLMTLEIYAIHFYIFALWFYVFESLDIYLKIFIVFVFTIITALFVISIMKRFHIISFIFFGQQKNSNVK